MKDDARRNGYIYQGMPSHYLERRRAANSASFFPPHLAPGMMVLDCGCGSDTIPLDFAELVAPGEVWGIDLDAAWCQWSHHPGAFLARTFCEAIAWKE